MFTKQCSFCGGAAIRPMDPYLNVKLCNTCREEQLEYVSEIKPDYIKRGRDQMATCLRAEKEEIEVIWADICSGNAQSDEDTIRWIEETANACKERQKYARVLEHYLENAVDNRSKELGQLRIQRRQKIKKRLEENGWEERDWQFSLMTAREWTNLVEAAKPLTDRVWQNLYPQLVPFLEKNRRMKNADSKARRRFQRKRRLHNLLIHVKNQNSLLSVDKNIVTESNSNSHPALASPSDDTPAENAADSNEDTSNSIAPTANFILRAPFPPIVDALKFPIISALLDEDVDADTMEDNFERSRTDIEQVILGWCSIIEEWFVTILDPSTWDLGESESEDHRDKVDSENNVSKPAVPKLEFQFKIPPGSNFPDKLRPHTQLLLRADSVFCMAGDELCPPPLYYPDLFSVFQDKSPGYFPPKKPSRWCYSERPKLGYPWDPRDVVPYPEGIAAAKALLHQLERPDAAQFELQALGARFSCGPCGEKWLMTWNEIVQHYAEAQIHALKAKKTETSTTYINSHSLEFIEKGKGKPLVVLHSQDECTVISSGTSRKQKFMQCDLCDKFDIRFRAPRDAMLKHVRAVHAIKSPQANHYSRTPDSQVHIEIRDPDTHTHDTDSDNSESPLYDIDYFLIHFGPAARWTDWARLRRCDMGWDTDKE
ncbi:unnamed protein product [Rhizoctonia solani]|uniref:Uncharacterized protein n=1 Tax=Rhizoctonia solani TaxID=456999 RepID=A0A8H3DDV0_9AGAM|nr:unnamed protein product [Rhizoctonia solani]